MNLPEQIQKWKDDGVLDTKKVEIIIDATHSSYYMNLEQADRHEDLENYDGPFVYGQTIQFRKNIENEIPD